MLCEVRIVTESLFLGNIRKPDGYRRFARDPKTNALKVDIPLWTWALRETLSIFPDHNNISLGTIRLPAAIRSPSFRLYKDAQRRSFEAIDINVRITFEAALTSCLPPGHPDIPKRGLTPEEFHTLLDTTGRRIGFAGWGGERGLGRFHVESLTMSHL
jgi:hypothetical protein